MKISIFNLLDLTKLINFIAKFMLILTINFLPLMSSDLSEKEIAKAKKYYSKMNVVYQKDIEEIMNSYPIYTNIKFRISPTSDNILDKMFTDLYYTGQVGKNYANSPYNITKEGNHYRAKIRDLVNGTIHFIKRDKRHNNYVFLIMGYYDTFITLRGKMLVDIKHIAHKNYVAFDIKAYVIINNSHMWRLARYIKSLPHFQSKIDKLIANNVRSTIHLGMRTVAGIKKDLKKKEF